MRHRAEPLAEAETEVEAEAEGEVEVGTGPVRFAFDGRTLAARRGQSIAGALWDHGILAWRTTRVGGRPRGAFCGMGVCFDCLVVINGTPSQRACLVRVSEGDVVTSQEGHGRDELGI